MSWSTLHFFVLSEFLKQSTGYLFLALAILIFLSRQRKGVRIGGAALLAGLGIFAHVSVVAWLAVILAGAFWLKLFAHGRLSAMRFSLIVLGITAIPTVLGLRPFGLPRVLASNISASPHWPIASIGVAENLALLITTLLMLGLILARRNALSSIETYVYGIVSLFTLWITLNPFLQTRLGSNSVSVRMQDLAQVPLALLLPGLICLLMSRTARRIGWSMCCLGILLALQQIDKTPHGITESYLQDRAQIADALIRLRGRVSAPIVAEHGNEFLATYYLGVDVEHDLPQGRSWDQVNWILRTYPCGLADQAEVLERSGEKCTVLIRGDILARQFPEMRRADQLALLGNNRHLYFAFHAEET